MPKKQKTHNFTVRVTLDRACNSKLAEKLIRDQLRGFHEYLDGYDGEPGEFRITAVRRQTDKSKPKRPSSVPWE
jgi:hypothetical protein